MKYLFFFLIILLLSCNHSQRMAKNQSIRKGSTSNKNPSKQENLFSKNLNESSRDTIKIIIKQNKIKKIIIPDDYIEDFEYKIDGNKLILLNELYTSLLNVILKFESDFELMKIRYKVKIKFKVLQHTTDDKPPYPINYSNIEIISKDIISNYPYIKIPEFSNDKNHFAFAKMFNFSNDAQLAQSIEKKHFKFIKPLSIKHQRKEYQRILNNFDKFRNCCPEYIVNAKSFFKKKKFNSFNDLSIEIYPDKIFLHITLLSKKNRKYNLDIINFYKE